MAQSSPLPFVYISGEEVRWLVSMSELIEEMSRGLQWVSAGPRGGVVQPVRSVVQIDKYSGNLGLMPAFAEKSDSLGAKLVTFYSQQAEGVPSHQAIVVVLDPQTGSLQAIVDGVMVTNMRTAAVSACAVRALVPHPPSILCIVGTGVQARSHAEALTVHHTFSEVLCMRVVNFDPTPDCPR
jgi:thiomorpholine-carboxylate dehydrogenase